MLFGGSVFTIYAGLYFWYPKMTGKMYNETLGKWHFWLTFITFNATFFPMHYIGMRGHAAAHLGLRAEVRRLEHVHHALARSCSGASTLIFVYNAIISWMRGEPAPDNPWRALTIEWQVSSPPPIFNFDVAAARRRRPVQLRPAGRHATPSSTRRRVTAAHH